MNVEKLEKEMARVTLPEDVVTRQEIANRLLRGEPSVLLDYGFEQLLESYEYLAATAEEAKTQIEHVKKFERSLHNVRGRRRIFW